MNKFFLMIFSVSVFFIGLGGVVNQISANFKANVVHIVMSPREQPVIGDNGKRSFSFVRKSDKHLNIEGEKIEMLDIKPKIKLHFPHPQDNKLEFMREQNSIISKQTEEFPRIEDKNIIIFQEKPNENPKTPQVRIFLDKKN